MGKTEPIVRALQRRLSAVRTTWLRVDFVSQALTGLALFAILWLLLVLLESVFRFDSPVRTVIVVSGIVVSALAFLWFVLRPGLRLGGFFRRLTDLDCAALVGAYFPHIRDRLLNVMQLQQEHARSTLYSAELLDASVEDLAADLGSLNLQDAVDRSPIHRSFRSTAVTALVVLAVVAVAPGTAGDAAFRLIHFGRDFTPPPEFLFEISPGTSEVLKGESVPVSIRVRSASGSPVTHGPLALRWKPEDQTDAEETSIRPDSAGLFETVLKNVRSNTKYFAIYQRVESEHHLLTVIDRPVIRSLRLRLDHPAYTRLPPRLLDEFVGDVTALPGTVVRLEGTASKSLAEGHIVFGDGRRMPLSVQGTGFATRFPLRASGTYHLEISDNERLKNRDPVTYRMTLLEDERPSVSILQPGRNLDIAGVSALPMLFQLRDDFGFSRLRLGWRLIHSRYEQPQDSVSYLPIPLPSPTALEAEVSWQWNLSPLSLVPEDVIEYFAEVFDSDAVNGPKSGRSRTYTLRLPSLEEVFTDLDRGHETTIDALRNTVEDARELRERIESINRDLKTNKPLDWQQQKQMEETARKYQDLQSRMEELHRELDAMINQMSDQQVLSSETLEKYLELQQLFEQLNSTELQRAFQQMQQALQTLNKQQLQQALQQVMFSEERFRESIERTLDLLKRIQIEQKLDELRKRAQELMSEQEEILRETEGATKEEDRGSAARRQEDLARKLEQMQRAAQDVRNRMEEFFNEMPERELQEAIEQLQAGKPSEKMDQAGQDIREGRMQQAQQTQQDLRLDLQQFSDRLDAVQMQMMQQQRQQVINELRRAVSDLLELSRRQEALKEQARTAPANSPQLRQNAQEQMGVMKDLANVISALQELSRRSFAVTPEMGKAIGEALARMQNAMNALDTRTGGLAAQEQGAAMSSLNKAAQQVQTSLQSLMQASGQGGILGQLQSLAGQQMSLNLRTQSLEDAARLAVEQEAIRKSLEQLNREAQASGEQRRILGNLENIAREMQEVVRNLEQNAVDQETVRKQERILSRLLDAARSARERDFEKKRRAETARTQVARRSPADLDPTTLEGRDRLREDLLKALEQGYSKDYEELIRRYFEELQKANYP